MGDAAIERAREAYAAYGHELRSSPSLEAARAAYERVAAGYPIAGDVACEPVDAGGVEAEWVTPEGADPSCVLVVVHGGGYASGSIATHRALAANVARAAGARALVLGYRLAPEHPFPAALDDVVTAYRWLLDGGVASGRVALLGDSAGGGLALSAQLALRDADLARPAATVLLGPWVDLTVSSESMTTNAERDAVVGAAGLRAAAGRYLGDADPRAPLASPIEGDLAGLAPMLIQVGSHEALLDDSRRLEERARAAGVDVTLEIWEGLMHSWHQYADFLPEARSAIEQIGRFVRESTR